MNGALPSLRHETSSLKQGWRGNIMIVPTQVAGLFILIQFRNGLSYVFEARPQFVGGVFKEVLSRVKT